jgi:hypothetical protein
MVTAVTANAYMTKIYNFRFQLKDQSKMTMINAGDKLKEYSQTISVADE